MVTQSSLMTQRSHFKYFKTSLEIIRLAVMLYVRLPLSLRNVEDLLHERGVDVSHETLRFWSDILGCGFRKSLQISALRPREGSTGVASPPPLH